MTVDRWSNISGAVLSWTLGGIGGSFDNITFNNTVIGTKNSGSADVTQQLQQGASNRVVLNYRCNAQTILFGQAAGNALVTLTVSGIIAADYNTILAQNAEFLAALQANTISQSDYNTAITQQNNQLYQLLLNGVITSTQYQAAISAEAAPAQATSSSGAGNPAATPSTPTAPATTAPNPLTKPYAGMPLYVWLIVAAVAVCLILFALWSLKK